MSTFSLRERIPSSAACLRLAPSKSNGFVTTATVSAPVSLATSAIIGAAPVPVPPPSPQVMKTMSAPVSSSFSFSLDSSAACRPVSGLPPEPNPLVRASPIWILIGALL